MPGGTAVSGVEPSESSMPGGTAVSGVEPSESSRLGGRRVLELERRCEPIVVSINGEVEIAVGDAHSIKLLRELVEWVESVEELRRSNADLDDGLGISLDDLRNELRAENGVPH